MSNFFIDKTDPHIAEILERLRRVNKILHKTETLVQPTLNNERFLTDEDLQDTQSESPHIAGVSLGRCNPLLPCSGQGSLQGVRD